MCGVIAAFAYGAQSPPIDLARMLRARDTMQLRGPDGAGLWTSADTRVALAHRRLSIIDLSENGSQPMASADGMLCITFNGEIYNYRELRAELEHQGCRFRSDSDTEVLLHLYAAAGRDMLHKLRGMFAFAIWDAAKGELFAARDPFGIKPLYYADTGETLWIASQVKALRDLPGIDIRPDPAGYAGFFLWGSVPEPFTTYRGIRALPAGYCLVQRAGAALRIERYFDLSAEIANACARPILKEDEARHLLREAVLDSVKYHLVADVPVAVFLSSGIDSSALAALACEASHAPPRSFTLGFDEFRGTADDETPLAEKMAATLGMPHTTAWVKRQDFEASAGTLFEAMDQPTIDGVNVYFVAQQAVCNGLKVALSGLGGDELLAGYPSFQDVPRMARWFRPAAQFPRLGRYARHISEPLVASLTSPKYAGLLEYGGTLAGAYMLRRGLFMPWELPRVMDPASAQEGWETLQTLAALKQTIPDGASPRLAISALELIWYMRNLLLRDADWAGMAHSLEIRVPLVDVNVFRAWATIAARYPSLNKRDLAATPATPLPSEIIHRPKTGFSVPVRDWIGGEGVAERGLRGWARMVAQRVAPAGHAAFFEDASA